MEHSGLTIVDLVAIGAVLISAGLALFRGFVRELLSLAAWAGAGVAAVYFYPLVEPWVHQRIQSPAMAKLAAGAAVYVAALVVLIPLGIWVASLVRGRALTAIDRSLGFLFGLGRGVLIVCLLFLVTLWVWPNQEGEPAWLAQAKTRPLMAYGADMLKAYIPSGDLGKATNSLLGEDQASRHGINENALDQPPTIVPGSATATTPPDKPTAYDLNSRDSLNQLVNQPTNPTVPQPVGKP